MSLFCSKTDLVTESDVEQKLIYPLLSSTQGLGYFAEEIKTKSYLAPTDLDKGAGRKVGYYPDYAVILSSLPALIVEAKAPGESVEQGFKEAQLYAHEINKRFPPNINPAHWVIATNGATILYGTWDCGRRSRTFAFQEALKIERAIHNAQSLVTTDKMSGANYVQESIQKTLDWKPPAPGEKLNTQNELFSED